MTEKYLWAGGAVVVGVVLGYALNDTSTADQMFTDRLDAVQAELSSLGDVSGTVEALSGKVEGLAGDLAAHRGAIDALGSDVAARFAAVESAGASAAETLESLSLQSVTVTDGLTQLGDRTSGHAEALAGASTALAALSAKVDTLRGDLATAITGAPTTPGAVAQPTVQTAKPAALAPAETQAGTSEADRLAAEVGADGLILSAGQTGTVGDTRLFLSRLSDDGAQLRVAGGGDIRATKGTPVDIGAGCTVTLAGMADRKAFLKSACVEEASADAGQAAPAELQLSVGQTGRAGDYWTVTETYSCREVH